MSLWSALVIACVWLAIAVKVVGDLGKSDEDNNVEMFLGVIVAFIAGICVVGIAGALVYRSLA